MARGSESQKYKDAALKFLEQGYKPADVAVKFGIPRSTVEHWKNKHIVTLDEDLIGENIQNSGVKIVRVLPRISEPKFAPETDEKDDINWVKASARTLFDTSEQDTARVSALRVYLEAIKIQRSLTENDQSDEEETTEAENTEVYSSLDTESLVRLYKDNIA